MSRSNNSTVVSGSIAFSFRKVIGRPINVANAREQDFSIAQDQLELLGVSLKRSGKDSVLYRTLRFDNHVSGNQTVAIAAVACGESGSSFALLRVEVRR
jgi:hypothetical protein